MMTKKKRIEYIQEELQKLYPNPKFPLNYHNKFTLLIAVLLSSQSTDKKVNQLTEKLFNIADTPKKMSNFSEEEIKIYIKELGLSNTKAKNIYLLTQQIIKKHKSEIPNTLEELKSLPGVGQKTASIIMYQAFNVPSFPIDTHIHRLMKLWNLTRGKNVNETEKDAKRIFPKNRWNTLHLQIIYYGREYSKARGWNLQKDFITRNIYTK